VGQGDQIKIAREAQAADQEFNGVETGATGEIQETVAQYPYGFSREEFTRTVITDVPAELSAADPKRIQVVIRNDFTELGNSQLFVKSMGQGDQPAQPEVTSVNGMSLNGRETVTDKVTQSEWRGVCATGETQGVLVWEVFRK